MVDGETTTTDADVPATEAATTAEAAKSKRTWLSIGDEETTFVHRSCRPCVTCICGQVTQYRCSYCHGRGMLQLSSELERVIAVIPFTTAIRLREVSSELTKRGYPMDPSTLTRRLALLVSHGLVARFNTEDGLKWERNMLAE